jgi:hypothetical protein
LLEKSHFWELDIILVFAVKKHYFHRKLCREKDYVYTQKSDFGVGTTHYFNPATVCILKLMLDVMFNFKNEFSIGVSVELRIFDTIK